MLSAVLGSPALRLIGKRLLTAVPILFGVSILMFALLNLIPGSAALQQLGPQATPEQIAQLTHEMGLDRPRSSGTSAGCRTCCAVIWASRW